MGAIFWGDKGHCIVHKGSEHVVVNTSTKATSLLSLLLVPAAWHCLAHGTSFVYQLFFILGNFSTILENSDYWDLVIICI